MEYDTENVAVEMIERFVDLKDQKVLEIGCGTGRLSKLLAIRTRKYVAIDPDEKSIERAKAEIPHVNFSVGSGEAMDFVDASFPVILFTLSLHHQDSRLALKEAYRVLTARGRLIILEPIANGELTQFFNLFEDESERILGALDMIENCDFEIEQKKTIFPIMSFIDQDDLCNYPFGRDKINAGDCARIIETLQQLRGPITETQRIHVQDDSRLFLLRKKIL